MLNGPTTPMDRKPFVVMAKPVGPVCNMACSYCYYLEKTQQYPGPHRFRMSDELLETHIRQYIEACPGPAVLFVWHGGEPTLAGLDFFRKAIELQKCYLPEGWTCWNNLQTNGLLLGDEWCTFLAAHHFDVGLSIDGHAPVHDAYRKDLQDCDTYERAAAAIHRLQAHGIQPDLLCTVTSMAANDPLHVYRALRAYQTGWIQFIPIVRRDANGLVTSDSVTGEAYGRFLCTVFDEWIHHDIGKLNVQFFAELMLVWSGGTANVCWMAPTCGRVPVVEHDGQVYACDHFVTPEYRIGNLAAEHLGALVDAPAQQCFGDDKRHRLPAQCRACPWLSVCNGGCPKERFAVATDGEPGLNYLCLGLQRFYEHAEKPLKMVIDWMRQGRDPESIMAALRAETLERWSGIGRNDPCICGSGRKAKNCCWVSRPGM